MNQILKFYIPHPLCFSVAIFVIILAGRVRYIFLLKGNVCHFNFHILNAHEVLTCCYCSIFAIFSFLYIRGNR